MSKNPLLPFGHMENDVVSWMLGNNPWDAWETVLDMAGLAYASEIDIIRSQCPYGHANYGHDDDPTQQCTCGICLNQSCPEKLEIEYMRAYLPVEISYNGAFAAKDCCATRGTIASFVLLQSGAPAQDIFGSFRGMPESLRELEIFAGYIQPPMEGQMSLFIAHDF